MLAAWLKRRIGGREAWLADIRSALYFLRGPDLE